jgi:pyridoxamine 5'-phosphate oxidase family protein
VGRSTGRAARLRRPCLRVVVALKDADDETDGPAGPSIMVMVFTETEIAYLASQRLGRLATVQRNGTLQVSPVGFSFNPATSTIDISGYNLGKSQKFRNIADNGRAAFVVDDLASVQPWRVRCIEIRGMAQALTTDGGPLIRLHPQRIISFGIDEPDTEAHSLTINSRNVE